METVTTSFSHKKISLERIEKATNNFSDENLIGEGGFGKVYRGNLEWSGEQIDIAARKLHYDYGQGPMEFCREIATLAGQKNRLKHRNLVSFIGFCDEKGEKIIVNKFEVNKSLDKHLNSSTLTWMQRLQICVGVARALYHIHYHVGYDSSFIHGNIKSSKILLDDKWTPKLCGFEHSKTNTKARRHRLVLAEVVGTIGYVDPTYEKTGFVTHKSDVYSFGVVLFEVLCGRRAFILDDQDECSSQYFEQNYQEEEMQIKTSLTEKLTSSNANTFDLTVFAKSPLITFSGGQPPSFSGALPDSSSGARPDSFSGGQPDSSSGARPDSFSGGQPESFSGAWPHLFSGAQPDSFSGGQPHSFSGAQPDSFSGGQPDSFSGAQPNSFSETTGHSYYAESFRRRPLSFTKPSSPADPQSIFQGTPSERLDRSSSFKVLPAKEQRFKLQPLFTMKRLEQYLHSPNEALLALSARSHYEGENLKDLIDPALWEQIDLQSFKIFTETAYNCLREQRPQRPNIDQILTDLETALKHQMRHDFPEQSIVAGEVEARPSKHWKGENLEHLKIPLIDIENATENFTKGFLGSGGYGNVYRADLDLPIEDKNKGELSKKRTTVAIKCIAKNKEGGEEGFIAEIELLTRCRHDNIVSLLGFCNEGPDLILVYEHAPNGALDDYLTNSINLTWVQRLKICIDTAEGLNYLHTTKLEDEQNIIHRDIKSGNILLGKNLAAKIADFGLSRFLPVNQQEHTHISNNIVGTGVYMCPEYRNERKLKKAIDIYSFGVVLFEILSGKLAYDSVYLEENAYGIAHVVHRRFKEGTLNEMIDPQIMEEVDELTSIMSRGPNQDSLVTFIAIAYWCLAETQNERPTTEDIIKELQKALLYQERNKHSLQMSFEEVRLATQNFSVENYIGGGGFGDVFNGEVKHANKLNGIVAKRWVNGRRQGENEFLTELEILFEYKHENIISLLGYCNEKNEKIIIYEYASNGSLDRHLGSASLTWMKRLQICIDVVRGLAFLHGGFISEEIVIHRDLKCANILLDDIWNAKISDFGLSLITPVNQENIKFVAGTIGYVDPEYKKWGYLTKESDIYSLGVILFEMLYGKLLVPNEKGYNEQRVITFLKKIHEEGKRDSIVFEGIKEQIAPESLSIFQSIVGQCLYHNREKRPTAEYVLKRLNKALEVQEAYETLQPAKLPDYYEEMIKMSISRRKFLSEKKTALYNMFSPGILLPKEKLWFSLGANGERNEMISAGKFSYKNRQLHKWRSIPESRFQKVAKMLDLSNLNIQIRVKTRFLSPGVMYGVHLVFKFCDLNFLPSKPMYVNLTYQMEGKTLHSYFATLRKDKWMMIELYRFLNHKEDNDFEVSLESLSRYYCGSDAIYVEGVEFRAMDKLNIEEAEQPRDVQSSLESNSTDYMRQLLTDDIDFLKRLMPTRDDVIKEGGAFYRFEWIYIDGGEKLFSLSKENRKKCQILQAKEVLYDSSNYVKFFTSNPLPYSRFHEVGELLSQHVFRLKCKIERQLLSSNTKYVCFLVFKLSEKCLGLHCPVKVRNLLNRKKKEMKILYFRSPTTLNLLDGIWVPEQRQDGWKEVRVWEFNTNYEFKSDHVPMNLKLICYEGTMSGLIIYGLEFRPM